MPKFKIEFGVDEGDEKGKVSFGGEKGDKFEITGPAEQLKGLKPDTNGIISADSLGSKKPKPKEDQPDAITEEQKGPITDLGDVNGLAIGNNAEGPNTLTKPGSYHIDNVTGLAIGNSARVNPPQEKLSPGREPSGDPKMREEFKRELERMKRESPKVTNPPLPLSDNVQDGPGLQIIKKFNNPEKLEGLIQQLGLKSTDVQGSKFPARILNLFKLASADPDLLKKLQKALKD